MAQVISNLLDNAAKYTPDGGKIHLSVAHDSGSVVVRVADNGRGIPPEKRDEIFKAFSQVEDHQPYRRGGLGIGLFLVKSIVEAHGGKVSVESDGDGWGSMFTVRLPIDRR
jgi:signal transduction histidine kinase